jgi:hypothetical protein
MTLVITNRLQVGYTGSAKTSYVSASFTPSARSKLYCLVWVEHNFGELPTITSVAGGSLTWTKKSSASSSGGFPGEISLWEADIGSSPSSMTVTMTSDISAYVTYAIFDVKGFGPAIVDGQIVASATGEDTGGGVPTLTTGTLPNAATTGNLVICCAAGNRDSGTVIATPSGFTVLGTPPSGGGQFELCKVSYSTSFTGTSTSFSNSPDNEDMGSIFLEIEETYESPTYLSSSISGASDTNSTSKTCPIPANTQANDIIVLALETTDPSKSSVTWPSGFTQIGSQVVLTGAQNAQNWLFAWKRSVSGEGTGNYTVSWSGNGWNQVLAMAIRGVTTSDPPYEDFQSSQAGSGTSGTAVNLTTTDHDFLYMFWLADSNDGSTDFSPPTGPFLFTEVQDTNYVELAYLEDSGIGSISVTGGTTSASKAHGRSVIAFKPPSSDAGPNEGSGDLTYTWGITATGQADHEGQAEVSNSWSLDAEGQIDHEGSAGLTYAWSITATGDQPPNEGSAAVSYSWGIEATAQVDHNAQAEISYSWGITATGHQPEIAEHNGSGDLTYSWGIVAEAQVDHEAQADVSYSWSITATGDQPSIGEHNGSADLTYAWGIAATAQIDHEAQAEVSNSWAIEAIAQADHEGSADLTYFWGIVATGDQPSIGDHEGSASVSYTWTLVAEAQADHEGSAEVSYTYDLVATGDQPTVGEHSGSASITYTWTISAIGSSEHNMSGAVSYSWAIEAASNTPHNGSGSIAYIFTITARGHDPSSIGVLQVYVSGSWQDVEILGIGIDGELASCEVANA